MTARAPQADRDVPTGINPPSDFPCMAGVGEGAAAGAGAGAEVGSSEAVVPLAVAAALRDALVAFSLADYADQAEVFTVHSKCVVVVARL